MMKQEKKMFLTQQHYWKQGVSLPDCSEKVKILGGNGLAKDLFRVGQLILACVRLMAIASSALLLGDAP